MEKGWIKLHRIIKEKPIWLASTPEQKTVLITILLMANHEENEWEWKGEKFKVLPGQFVTSLESIRANAGKGISIQNVRSSLLRFEKLQFLTYKSTMCGRVVTICNWEDYQQIESNTQQRSQQRGNKGATTNKNDKNEKNNISVIFDEFRKAYPGTKRGLKTELDEFLKKNDPDTVNMLLPALKKEIAFKNKLRESNQFCPEWKNLKTWLNQKCWEQEFQLNGKNQTQLLSPIIGMQR